MSEVTIVVPCYNEALRLDIDTLESWVRKENIRLLFVDDGSTDTTRDILTDMESRVPARVSLLCQEDNLGKGEAVRRGLGQAVQSGAEFVGYLDADLSTGVNEANNILNVLQSRSAQVAIGSRVPMMGHSIRRPMFRHYLGRVFATMSAPLLPEKVYDTQCGAKFFRVNRALVEALKEPYISRWIFDIELIGRLLIGGRGVPGLVGKDFVEVPLLFWTHSPNSKIKVTHGFRVILDLLKVYWDLTRRRRVASGKKSFL